MNKILFSHSYFLRFDPKQWTIGQPYPPLGTLYGAAFVRAAGNEVSLFDTQFSRHPSEIIPALDEFNPDFFVIYDDGFNYLTKMCLTNMREAAFGMIRLAKTRGCISIVSSSDSTDQFKQYLDEGADFILLGEAEETLLELITAIQNGQAGFSQIKGLAFKQEDKYIKTERRPVIRNLDALPMPAWDLIDLSPYRNTWISHAGYFSLNTATTRGCPFKCNWCAKPIYGNRYNARSPRHVVKELKWLKSRYSFDHIWFCDDIFGLKPGWVNEFADLIEAEKLKFKFKIQARADLLLEENNVSDLARAGCDNIWMGAESGSQKILDAMDKGITVEQIKEATRLIRKYHMKPSFFIQFGYPGETKEDIEMTIRMINELLPYELGISVSYPLPGTVFYEKVKHDLIQKSNWTDSDEMALMFRNTFQPAFYKQLHRFVHKSYRKHIAFENLRQLVKHPAGGRFSQVLKALSGLYYVPAAYIDKRKLNQLEKN
ncbi:MAG TPA: radical SAM protein [Puia sp.]